MFRRGDLVTAWGGALTFLVCAVLPSGRYRLQLIRNGQFYEADPGVLTLAPAGHLAPKARATDPATSHDAAARALTSAAFKRLTLLRAHMLAGERGLIGRDHLAATGWPYEVVGPRRRSLADDGYVAPNGQKRDGQEVWVATEFGARYWWALDPADRAGVEEHLAGVAA